jgi:hypothetical protein
MLHFKKIDHLPGNRLKPTAIPKLYGPPNKLYSLFLNIKYKKAANGHQPQKKGNNKHLLDELQLELSNANCFDCADCGKILSEAIAHLRGHREEEKEAPTPDVVPPIEIKDDDDDPLHLQQVTLFVKKQGNVKLYQCPCCPIEMKYPEITAHIRSHERPPAENTRRKLAPEKPPENKATESIVLIDASDEETTETSSGVLGQMNFRARKKGGTTVYVCNTCNAEVPEDIISHFATHQMEDDAPVKQEQGLVEVLTGSSDDDEEEEEIP